MAKLLALLYSAILLCYGICGHQVVKMGKSTRVAPDMMEDVPEGKREVVGVLESKGVK